MSENKRPEDTERAPQWLVSESQELQLGDFYFEGPYMVFTEQFLTRRGYCCNSGCRHCPYK